VSIRIVPASERDLPLVHAFVRELAEYERLLHEVRATDDALRETLFGPNPAAEIVIAYDGSEPAGFALFFQSYSTFLARPGLYLEDLFVRPSSRKRGIGRKLLEHLAGVAVARNYGRLEWRVLDWNEPAIRFYRSIGAEPLADWTVFRVTGKALKELAETEPVPGA
jgi:GNAT superfamily N-acetyltransferase